MTEKYLTKDGLAKMEKEIEYLKKDKRIEIRNRIAEAIKLGDLSENAEYHDSKDSQGLNEAKIRELDDIIKNVVIIEDSKNKETIDVGCTIKVELNGQESEFTIVGPSEADPSSGIISNESPLGQAFLGKKIGDKVEVEVPAGKIVYKIKSVQ